MRRFGWLLAGLALIAVLFSVALAKDEGGGKGQRGGQERRGGPPVVFGEITALGENSMTVKPELPPQMKERMTERRKQNGREMPKLPDSIKIKLGPDTKWYFDGAEGSRKDFAVGDTVVVKMLRSKDAKQPVAEAVSDPETAKQYIMEKMKERRGQDGGPGSEQGGRQGRGKGDGRGRGDRQGGPDGGWGQGGPDGDQGYGPGPGGPGGPDGPGDDQGFGPGPGGPDDGQGFGRGPGGPGGPGMGNGGPGGPGGPGMGQRGPGGPGGHRPMFGAVISVDRNTVTIRPDVPDFVAKMMKEHDMPVPQDLPDSVALPLDEFTVFINRGEKVNKNPFIKGERVAIMMGRDENDQPVARAIVDLMTAKAKIEKMMQNRGGEGGERGRGDRQGDRRGEQRDRGEGRADGRRNPK